MCLRIQPGNLYVRLCEHGLKVWHLPPVQQRGVVDGGRTDIIGRKQNGEMNARDGLECGREHEGSQRGSKNEQCGETASTCLPFLTVTAGLVFRDAEDGRAVKNILV